MYSGPVESCGQRIATALKVKGIKQADLCKAAKIPKSSLSLYLSGAYEPKQDRLYQMAQVLGVDPVWLMGFDVPMEKEKNISPDKLELTEGEKVWLELYHQLSSETKAVLVNMAEEFENLSADRQKFLLDAVRVVFDNQK